MRTISRGLCALALSVAGTAATANTLTWIIAPFTFANGSTVSGSYDFNTVTWAFTAIDVSISAGTGFEAETFRSIAPNSGNYYGATFTNLPLFFDTSDPACLLGSTSPRCGSHALWLNVQPAQMGNSGGSLSTSLYLGHCNKPICNNNVGINQWQFQLDYLVPNATTVSAVPEPSALVMALAGLLIVAPVARRMRR